MDFKKIAKVLDIMEEHELSEFTYEEHEKFKISLKSAAASAPRVLAAGPATPAPVANNAAPAQAAGPSGATIDSPLVGTFYAASSPDTPDYVKEGDTVKPDDVVCIVEAMKVMNEIRAEVSGVITKILVSNAEAVEYGQPLFEYKPI